VTEFVVELYLSRGDTAAVERHAQRTRRAARELSREGTPVRYLRSIFVPEDETCLVLLQAGSADVAREAARRAALPFERLTEAIGDHELEHDPALEQGAIRVVEAVSSGKEDK
jgi:hypothetical protein